jgi:L-ribulose-5-phosphate 3-epimerase UlaE
MIREDTWPIIDQFFREMPEAIGKLPTFQEALTDSLKQGEKQGALHHAHQTVFRQLQHRFNQVPNGIVQQIEASSSLEQLDQWLDQIIAAKKLEEIERLFQKQA